MPFEMWNENARVVVIAAHPDDETIGLGGHLAQFADVTLIHVTDGAPRRRPAWKSYAQTRHAELLCAAAIAGIRPERCIQIGLPDQQAAHHLVELSCALSRCFEQLDPEIVFTHPYEGGHPDHDATAFAVHHAAPAAKVLEFASYHRGADGEIETGCFLDDAGVRMPLDERQKSQKRRMLDCFASQRETLAWFGADQECFRRAPEYDFTLPPHDGPLFYESFDWGCDGSEWLRLSRRASKAIGTCLSR